MDDEHTWRRVMDIISRYDRPVVVVSATARTTRTLVEAAETAYSNLEKAMQLSQRISGRHRDLVINILDQISPENRPEIEQLCLQWIDDRIAELNRYLEQISRNKKLSPKIRDAVASTGEQLSSFLFARAARIYGLNTKMVDAGAIIKTDSTFGSANPLMDRINENSSVLKELIADDAIPVIGGYFGRDDNGDLTTLGFEGSDYTASILGAVLSANTIEIWTDVSGIFTCDPRYVKEAKPISAMTFREATELAYFGAKVLHPATMKPASQKKIPVLVRNIFEPDHPGTRIGPEAEPPALVRAMTFLENVVTVTVTSDEVLMGHTFLSSVFKVLDRYRLTVDAVTTTEASVSIAFKKRPGLDRAVQELKELGDVKITKNHGLISLIGCSKEKTEDIIKMVLGDLSGTDFSMISFSKSKQNLNMVLDPSDLPEAVEKIHHSLFVNQRPNDN